MQTHLGPISVFVSYVHEDEFILRKLETHLSLLKRQRIISIWHDQQIIPGTDRSQAIDKYLEQSSIILLLVSADFLASDYCYQIEMQRALERHEAGQARVIPVVIRPVDWKNAPFAHLQALPTNARAITTWNNQDEAFVDIVAGIRQAIEDLSSLNAPTPRSSLPSMTPLLSPSGKDRTGEIRTLPTFEVGECTEVSSSKMECTGEIIRGVDAATRVVEEIELETKPSDNLRFDVRVAGIGRIREYLAALGEPVGSAIEERHKLRMALLDWEKHLEVFRTGVEYILWNSIFRTSVNFILWNSNSSSIKARDAAEIICGLSEHCFGLDYLKLPITWFLWYEDEQKTLRTFLVTEDVKDVMERGYYEDDYTSGNRRQGLTESRAYPLAVFSPGTLHQHVIPPLLMYIAEKRVQGAFQAELDKYLDISRWKWSVHHPGNYYLWQR